MERTALVMMAAAHLGAEARQRLHLHLCPRHLGAEARQRLHLRPRSRMG